MRRPWHVIKRPKTIRNWVVLGLSISLSVFVVAVVCYLFGVFEYHTSDKVLIENFRAHRHDFETLASMAIEDDLTGLYDNSVMLNDYKLWPADGSDRFSQQRWNEYDALFKRLGPAAQHMLMKESGVVLVPASIIATEPDADYTNRVSEKGYAFSQTPLSPLNYSLDGMGVDDLGTRYRRIDEHWYLYHDCSIGKPE
ncbi:MAG TPA: hypothetical protein VGO56_02730 [Pyrinomonadaceae bacterium]|jgi:hypothetical protein|nr:hypothetical protein [Pyrinomonadaceae bacterium]